MKALPTITASFLLAATLQAMPANGFEATAPASNGFINTQIGYTDIANKTVPAPTMVFDGTRFDFVQTNGAQTAAGGFGGSASPAVDFTIREPLWALEAPGGTDGIAQPNGPAQAVPEPSSSWLLLALAVIPILKVRSSRKIRAS